MTLAEANPTEIQCSADEARRIVQAINDTANNARHQLRSMLAHAREVGAHRALGYQTFDEFGEAEFGLSRRTLFNWLAVEEVTRAVASATGVECSALHSAISSRAANELKPHLDEVVRKVEEATRDADPDVKAEAAKAAVEEIRKEIIEERERAKAEQLDDQDDEDDYVRVEDIADVEPEPKPAPVRKKDLGNGIHHPARYSDNLIPKFAEILGVMFHGEAVDVLDPFGGTGRIHELDQWGHNTCAVEIEPEWANMHERTLLGSALDLSWVEPEWDAIVTSPTYGNRLADSHNASDADRRFSYTHDLGRKLHDDNSGAMQWGDRYRQFHVEAWNEALRVLKRNGVFILNIKDHIRNGRRQHVAGWHVTTLCRMGLTLLEHHEMGTKNLAVGANATERLNEQIYVFVKGEQ